MEFTNFVVMIIVSVGLSLGCSYILFKTLKSSATIKKPKVKLGGAIAGFLVILGLLLNAFNFWYEKETEINEIKNEATKAAISETEEKWKPERWTICAKIKTKVNDAKDNGNSDQSGIIGRVMPSRMEETEPGGYFRLEVDLTPDEKWPDIMFQQDGFSPQVVDQLNKWINEKNTKEIEYDEQKKKITLVKSIVLEKLGGYK